MPMRMTLDAVRETLEAEMTTNVRPETPYFVKTWYVGSHIGWEAALTPIGVIRPEGASQVDQYVEEDTEVDTVVINFYARPIRHAGKRRQDRDLVKVPDQEDAKAAVVAMVDQAKRVLRRDPTLGNRFFDGKVVSSLFREPGYAGIGAITHEGEIRYQSKQRVPWQGVGFARAAPAPADE